MIDFQTRKNSSYSSLMSKDRLQLAKTLLLMCQMYSRWLVVEKIVPIASIKLFSYRWLLLSNQKAPIANTWLLTAAKLSELLWIVQCSKVAVCRGTKVDRYPFSRRPSVPYIIVWSLMRNYPAIWSSDETSFIARWPHDLRLISPISHIRSPLAGTY